MIREDYQPTRGNPTALGIDVGASLAKRCLQHPDGAREQRLFPAAAVDAVARDAEALRPDIIGLTGGGSGPLADRLGRESVRVNEFAAWGAGARVLLREQGAADARHLLVSLGTGTSVMLVDGMAVTRVGGTALGGGTLVGLGAALLGAGGFEELIELAGRGDRRRVDLLVSDIYRAGEFPLAADLTAASFGKLGREGRDPGALRREDLAHAIVGLVGENVALICGGLAATHQVARVVFAGSSLRENPGLRQTLHVVTSALGREPTFLTGGEFAGALGALLLASDTA